MPGRLYPNWVSITIPKPYRAYRRARVPVGGTRVRYLVRYEYHVPRPVSHYSIEYDYHGIYYWYVVSDRNYVGITSMPCLVCAPASALGAFNVY